MPTHASRRRAVPILAASLLLAASASSLAHGPTRQKVTEKVTIEAPADAVWAKVKNFNGLKDWHPAVADSPADKGNAEGSVRTLKLKDGGTLVEALESYDDAHKKYSYRAKDGGALPVTNYTSTLSVVADGGKSVVEWRGAFYRGYPNNDPPPDRNDEAALKAVTGVYRGGLGNLKKMMESK
ncbi:SRPBCC family protein [Variovorax sp. WS11]|uniref:SRPBCC family protein n=1 Tax=Variovorax sp. WS11 TaxID=1105204 RepID=UPI000D0D351D|nr:SRPBCC family protein [Variovorax sp. WS11]NDZ11572.1 SRPBCC family protein [Variovorax sp. WS11]PSL86580.1 SRPBCC family protein [Variovorax sp. WS11]